VTSTARVSLSPEDVAQIVDDIVGAFLADRATEAPAGDDPGEVVACVHVTGAFTGSVICSVSAEFATLCATRMLAVDPSEVDDEAVADAIGEVVNMIGGSVKALLPEPSALSLPLVSVGGRQVLSVRGAAPVASVDLRCAGQPLRVTVLESRG
jgi:chemotaxis protein CheX